MICGQGCAIPDGPDQLPGIGWEQGTEQDWLRHLVSYWADTFDWRAVGTEASIRSSHFTWEGIHFVHHRAASWPGCAADPHTRLAQQFSRLCRHAADA